MMTLNDDDETIDTITFKRTHVYLVLLPLAFVTGLLVGYLFWGRQVGSPTGQPIAESSQATDETVEATAEAAAATPQQVTRYNVPEDDDPVWGPEDAAITIIEFSDYECPYCQKWHMEIWPRLQAEYPGQLRLVYRDFPLTSIHANATPAAAAANCAREQAMYWEFNDLLFSMRYNLNESGYKNYAQELGLEMADFEECLASGRYNDEVQADFDYAANLGVRSTPTFFLNGIPLVGAQPFEVFKDLIDRELAGEL